MQTDQQRLEYLLTHADWNEGDQQWMRDYLKRGDLKDFNQILQQLYNSDLVSRVKIDSEISQRIRQGIKKRISKGQPDYVKKGIVRQLPRRHIWSRSIAAAIILMVGLTTFYLLFNQKRKEKEIVKIELSKPVRAKIASRGNNAILTLANGSKIVLNNAANGILATQGNTRISKLANGELTYKSLNEKPVEVVYNSLSTPRGGEYKLTLPDGSKVWLNAASSIHYPTFFGGHERKVEITGEAYFEVAKNAAMPFIVAVNGMTVQVLGTHFNVMAYDNEAVIKTTLLEGAVRVTKGNAMTLLKPGQQAKLNGNGELHVVKDADVDEAIAWKNGYFHFGNSSIRDVMRQLERWYDVEVVYEGQIPQRKFGGEVSRNINVSQVLKILEVSRVHFRMEGKKIIVTQ